MADDGWDGPAINSIGPAANAPPQGMGAGVDPVAATAGAPMADGWDDAPISTIGPAPTPRTTKDRSPLDASEVPKEFGKGLAGGAASSVPQTAADVLSGHMLTHGLGQAYGGIRRWAESYGAPPMEDTGVKDQYGTTLPTWANAGLFDTSQITPTINKWLGTEDTSETGLGHIAHRAGELGGSALMFGRMGPKGSVNVKPSNLAIDVGAGTAAGTAGGVTQQLGGSPEAQAAAELAGGAGVATAPRVVQSAARNALRAGRTVLNPVGEGQQRAVDALDEMRSDQSQSLADQLSGTTGRGASGVPLDTATQTSDAGLINLSRHVGTQTPEGQRLFGALKTDQNQAIGQAVRAAVPNVPDSEIEGLTDQVKTAYNNLGTNATPESVGEAIRDAVQSRRNALVGQREAGAGQQYEQAFGEARGVDQVPQSFVPAQQMVQELEAQRATQRGRNADELGGILDAFKNPNTGEYDYSAEGLANTSKALGELSGRGSAFGKATAGRYQQQLTDALGSGPVPSLPGAREAYRQQSEPINKIDQGPGGPVLATHPYTGDYAMPGSRVAGKYLDGTAEGARALVNDTGSPEGAAQVLRSRMVDELGGNPDTITAKNLAAVRAKYGDAMAEIDGSLGPSTRRITPDFETLAGAQAAASRRIAQQGLTSKFYKQFQNAGVDLEGDFNWSDRLNKFVSLSEPDLVKMGLNTSQIGDLKTLAGDIGTLQKREAVLTVKGSATAQNIAQRMGELEKVNGKGLVHLVKMVAGLGIGGVAGKALGMKEGIGEIGGAIAGGGTENMMAGKEAQMQSAMRDAMAHALVDPEFAKALVARVTPRNRAQLENRFSAHIANVTGDYERRQSPAGQ